MEQARLKSRARRGKLVGSRTDVMPQVVDEQPEAKISKQSPEPDAASLIECGDIFPDALDVAPAKMTLDELRAEMQREAAEVRLANRMKQVLEIQEKKQAKADAMAPMADAAKFALGRVEGDDDMPELQRHWRKQLQEQQVLINDASCDIDCYISLTEEEQMLLEEDALAHALAMSCATEQKPPVKKGTLRDVTPDFVWTKTGFEC